MSHRPALRLVLPLLGLLCLSFGRDARADEAALPLVEGVRIDGVLDEPAWAEARRVPADPVTVPVMPRGRRDEAHLLTPLPDRREIVPEVRLAQSAGLLLVGVRMDETPGVGTGLVLLAASEGESAASAAHVLWQPRAVDVAAYTCRSAEGVGRAVLRAVGVLGEGKDGTHMEFAVPLAELGASGEEPLRLQVLVTTRTPNLASVVPAGSRWKEPEGWLVLPPPPGGWPEAPAKPDPAPLIREDLVDRDRLVAWDDWLRNNHALMQGVLVKQDADAARAQLEDELFAHLRRVIELRPDLEADIRVILADAYRQLGLLEEANRDLARALELRPDLPEAHFLDKMVLQVDAAIEGAESGITDYPAAYAALDALLAAGGDMPFLQDHVDCVRGMLLYREGDYQAAGPYLDRVGARYPQLRRANLDRREVSRYEKRWFEEVQARRVDEQRGLPRVTVETSEGKFEIELFADRAPNTAANFLRLVEAGWYEGTTFHRAVPYFCIQGGDPFSKEGMDSDKLGLGGPGYFLPKENTRRPPLRSMVGMASRGGDTLGCQFFVLTGAAHHIDGEFTIFGRVISGMDVVDRIRPGTRMIRLDAMNLPEGGVPQPRTVGGTPAPEPRPIATENRPR